MTTNMLFVCSRNQWRSPTAERVFSRQPGVAVRSGGTSPKARRQVCHADIKWADVIFAMEPKHKARLMAQFARVMQYKKVHVLDVSDDYRYMDDELVEILQQVVPPLLS